MPWQWPLIELRSRTGPETRSRFARHSCRGEELDRRSGSPLTAPPPPAPFPHNREPIGLLPFCYPTRPDEVERAGTKARL
jgi:hypothetical protein